MGLAMPLRAELYVEQASRWPSKGKHILAHYAAETIVVYQAYRSSIGEDASNNGAFAVDFFLLTNELDQAEFLVDDVSIWMGYKGRSRDHPWPSLASSLLRQPTCSRDCFKLGSIRSSHQRRMQSQSPVPTCDCSGIPI